LVDIAAAAAVGWVPKYPTVDLDPVSTNYHFLGYYY
jgi:hypothetical protein